MKVTRLLSESQPVETREKLFDINRLKKLKYVDVDVDVDVDVNYFETKRSVHKNLVLIVTELVISRSQQKM